MVRGAAMAVWKHVPATAAGAFARARGHGAREFLVYQNERVSYDAFARAALAVAALLAGRGLQKGDRVALVMRNLPEWPVVFMGALLAGAIAVPLNAWWTGTELAYGIWIAAPALSLPMPSGWRGWRTCRRRRSLSPAPPIRRPA